MVNFEFRGLMAPVFTPFNDDKTKSLNLDLIPRYAQYLKENGVDGILVNGTTGEGVSQSVVEREQAAEAWKSASLTTGQCLMVQVGGASLVDVQRLARHAESIGAAAILCLADLFHQPRSADDLLHYLRLVGAAAPNTPLLYYHIPGFTGIDINMKEMLEKAGDAEIPTFVGIKFTCNDLSMGASLLPIDNWRYAIFLGSDTILAAAFCLGFDSAIGTTLNMFPKLNQGIVSAINVDSFVVVARDMQTLLSSAVQAISKHGSWVATMKAAMRLMTPIDVGPVRDPLLELTPEQLEAIKADLSKLELLNSN